MRGVGDEHPVGVEERAGEVEPLLDVDREGSVLEGEPHLLGDRHEAVVEDLQHDRVAVRAGRRFAREGNGALQHEVAARGEGRPPSGLHHGGRGGLEDDGGAVQGGPRGERAAPVDRGFPLPAVEPHPDPRRRLGPGRRVRPRPADALRSAVSVPRRPVAPPRPAAVRREGVAFRLAGAGRPSRGGRPHRPDRLDRSGLDDERLPGHDEPVAAPVGVLEAGLHRRRVPRLHEVGGVRPVVADVGAAKDPDARLPDPLGGQLRARLVRQRVERPPERRRPRVVEPGLHRPVAERPHVGEPHAVGGEHARERMDHDPGHAERVRDEAGVLAARPAEAVEGVAGHVVAPANRDGLDRVRHVVHRDAQEPLRDLDRGRRRAARACRARRDLGRERFEPGLHRPAVEGLVLPRPEHPRKEPGLELAEEYVAVGDAQGAAAPVAGGPRVRPGRPGADPVARAVEGEDRAAARRHGVDHHHRGAHPHPGHHRLERPFVGPVVVGDVGGGAPHVEGDDALAAGPRRGLHRPDDASRRAGQDRVLALEPPGVGEPAVRLHEHEARPLAELRRDPVDVAAKER